MPGRDVEWHLLLTIYNIGLNEMEDEERNLIEILEENNQIDITKYIGYVRSPKCGAIATFAGTTRDTFEGKEVLELRYEAYVPMAIRCLKSLCSATRKSWDVHSIAVAHCLGTVPVGEISVFVATSAPHRADALDACKFLIDELKALVPIWKKEVYTNGEVWKENKEFIERIPDLGKTSEACSSNTRIEARERKSCCGAKIKVSDETEDSRC